MATTLFSAGTKDFISIFCHFLSCIKFLVSAFQTSFFIQYAFSFHHVYNPCFTNKHLLHKKCVTKHYGLAKERTLHKCFPFKPVVPHWNLEQSCPIRDWLILLLFTFQFEPWTTDGKEKHRKTFIRSQQHHMLDACENIGIEIVHM